MGYAFCVFDHCYYPNNCDFLVRFQSVYQGNDRRCREELGDARWEVGAVD